MMIELFHLLADANAIKIPILACTVAGVVASAIQRKKHGARDYTPVVVGLVLTTWLLGLTGFAWGMRESFASVINVPSDLRAVLLEKSVYPWGGVACLFLGCMGAAIQSLVGVLVWPAGAQPRQ